MESMLPLDKNATTDNKDEQEDETKNKLDNNDEDSEELLEWDDEDFELDLEDIKITADDGSDRKATASNEEDALGNDEDEWLAPIQQDEQQGGNESNVKGDNIFLTKQFQRLSTPVDKKKARCVICTRPVPDFGKPTIYCERHMPDTGKKIVKWSDPVCHQIMD